MEKILLKKMMVTFLIIYVSILIIFSGIIFETHYLQTINELKKVLEQVESTYENTVNNQKVAQSLFEEDYLNRAKVIDYILTTSQSDISTNELINLKKLMDLNNIFLINDTGEIINSSDENSIGINLLKNDKSKKFYDLIENEKQENFTVDFNAKSIIDNKDVIYLGVKSQSKKYNVVQIQIDKSVYESILKQNLIYTVIRNTPTIDEDSFFIIDKNTGKIKSITRNTYQTISFDDVDSANTPLYINKLLSCQTGAMVEVNGNSNFMMTKDMGDNIIGVSMRSWPIYKDILVNIVYLLIVCTLIFVTILVVTLYNIKKYILSDLLKFKNSVYQLMQNDYTVEFKATYDTEFKDLGKLLNWWRDSYKHKSYRMTKLVSKIDTNLAMFESLETINKTFCSDNIKDILEINSVDWAIYKNNARAFKIFIKELVNKYKQYDNVVHFNDKYLKVIIFEDNAEFYGVIYDITESMAKEREVQTIIKQAEFKSEIDRLTQIYNRYGLDRRMNEIIEHGELKGILFIFDLDNFKVVNDNEGHPVGDRVLKIFADKLKAYFNSEDIIARIGGDEFVVFMRTYLEKDKLINKVNTFITQVIKDLDFYNREYNLSTSVGIVYSREDISSYEELYAYADAALYKAKRQGKNRFCINEEYRICLDKDCSTCKGLCPKMQSG